MMWELWIFYFSLIGNVYSILTTNSASLDNLIDEITSNIKNKGMNIGLESFTLPDINITNKAGVFNLTNGVLYNLTTIERFGSSRISYIEKKFGVKLGFHFTGLKVNYDFNIHTWDLNPTGTLTGRLNNLRFFTEGYLDLISFNGSMSKLTIPTTGDIDFSVQTTVPIYKYIVKNVLLALTPFQDILVYEIGKELKSKINELLHNISQSTTILENFNF